MSKGYTIAFICATICTYVVIFLVLGCGFWVLKVSSFPIMNWTHITLLSSMISLILFERDLVWIVERYNELIRLKGESKD